MARKFNSIFSCIAKRGPIDACHYIINSFTVVIDDLSIVERVSLSICQFPSTFCLEYVVCNFDGFESADPDNTNCPSRRSGESANGIGCQIIRHSLFMRNYNGPD